MIDRAGKVAAFLGKPPDQGAYPAGALGSKKATKNLYNPLVSSIDGNIAAENMKITYIVTASISVLLAAPLQSALIANWNFDELSGNVSDATGNHSAGVHIGGYGYPSYAQPGVSAGTYGSLSVIAPAGKSVGFGPSTEDDFFVVGSSNVNPVLNIDSTGAFTAMGWVNPNSPTAGLTYRFLSTGSSAGADRGWGLGLRMPAAASLTGSIRLTTYGVADNDSSTFPVTYGSWMHIAVTYNNGAISYYMNGNALDTDTSLFGNEGIAGRLVLGGRIGGNDTDQMNGLVDGIRLYDSVLSPADIRNAAIASVSVPEPSATLLGLAVMGLFALPRKRRALR